MTRIIWAPQAVEDVEAIRTYVSRDSAHYADLLVEQLVAAVSRLEAFPQVSWVCRILEAGPEGIEVEIGDSPP